MLGHLPQPDREVNPFPWMDDAACLGADLNLFFPEGHSTNAKAKSYCDVCPVKAECLQFALDLDERYGIYGGLTAKERQELA